MSRDHPPWAPPPSDTIPGPPSLVLWLFVHATPQRWEEARWEQGGTYLGRPWLGRLAGPGHSKGALSRTGLPGRQDASLSLCGLVTSQPRWGRGEKAREWGEGAYWTRAGDKRGWS